MPLKGAVLSGWVLGHRVPSNVMAEALPLSSKTASKTICPVGGHESDLAGVGIRQLVLDMHSFNLFRIELFISWRMSPRWKCCQYLGEDLAAKPFHCVGDRWAF